MRSSWISFAFTILVSTQAFALPSATSEADAVPGISPRQLPSIKSNLGWQLSAGSAGIVEPNDGQTIFDNAKNRWSDFNAPGVSAVVKAFTEQDIVKTIQYANSIGRPFLIQNSGHGWPDMTNTQNVILIKVDSMKSIVVDTNQNNVKIGPGVNMGELIAALYAVQRQTTLGTCDCPGVIGALLGGGHGRLQGMYGLMADQLISARVILHNGSIVTASENENVDLFWGLRGAGHNLGVVVSATIKVYPVQVGGLHYNSVTFYEDSQLETIFGVMNNITLPERSSAYVMFFHEEQTKRPFIAIDFTYAGRAEDGEALLRGIFDARIPQYTQRQSNVFPWSQLNTQGMLGIATLWCERGWRKNTFSTGLNWYNLPDVRTVWNGYKQMIVQHPEAVKSMYIWETYPMQGMRNRDWTTTAYPNRAINHIVVGFMIYEKASLDATMTTYGNNAFRTVLNANSGFNGASKVYVNYAHGNEKKAESYGWETWRQQKLIGLKQQYDPLGRFNAYHPIPTTLAGFTA